MKKENVTILVDTRNTHNFIDITVAKRLNLFVYPTADIRVMIADGKRIDGVESVTRSSYKYKTMNWNLVPTQYLWEE